MSSRGNSGPSDRWIDVHDSSFDDTGSWIFDEKGEDVNPGVLECSASYYATARITRNVRRCPSRIRLFLLRFKVRRKARRLARSVASRCETKICRSRISFQYEAWFCSTVVATGRSSIESGCVYKVKCYKT
jgi:hypothetical protein